MGRTIGSSALDKVRSRCVFRIRILHFAFVQSYQDPKWLQAARETSDCMNANLHHDKVRTRLGPWPPGCCTMAGLNKNYAGGRYTCREGSPSRCLRIHHPSHALTPYSSQPTPQCRRVPRSRKQGISMPTGTAMKRKRISSKPHHPTSYMLLEMFSAVPPQSLVSPSHSGLSLSQALANDCTGDGRVNVSLTSKSPAKLAELLHLSRTPVSAVHEPVSNNGSWRCPRLNIVIHVVGSRGKSFSTASWADQ